MENEVVSSNLADRLKRLRKSLGISAAEMADKTNISLPTIRKIEQGSQDNPTIQFVNSLKQAFGVNANWLVDGTGDMFETNPQLELELAQTKAILAEKEDTIKGLLRAYAKLQGELKRVTPAQGVTSKIKQFLLDLPTPATTRRTAMQ
ncbi:helix-turn-helix domain-containing protein [Fibrella sp. WM1]|uniref:helix-turn-helix domain-containing protein n=1 Tax=Fibrella musci TaxID=3242485 RepID=UPI003521C0FE